tara:strand:- start:724 stop:957 length:234 start_codon:yes stop_codon:yes gene_type:complete
MSYSSINKLMSTTIDLEQEINTLIENVSNEFIPCPNNKEEIEHELIVASRAIGRIYSLALDNMEGYRNQLKEDEENY